MSERTDDILVYVASQIAKVVPDFCGVTLGGSRSHDLEDSISDAEMYFYSTTGIPTENDLEKVMEELEASHKRSDSFLWNEQPWGPYSFFVYKGIYFEVGYRIVDEVIEKIEKYHSGEVKPRSDCNDLGLGYMLASFSASVVAEKKLYQCGELIDEIKRQAALFDDDLFNVIKVEYFDVAKSFLNGKLLVAAKRADYLFYDIIASRIVRSLFVMAFAIGRVHFPGDKWNEHLLKNIDWEQKDEFLRLIREHYYFEAHSFEEFLEKRNVLVKAVELVEAEMEK